MYIDLGTSHFHRDNSQTSRVFDKLSKTDKTIDEKIAESEFKVFGNDTVEDLSDQESDEMNEEDDSEMDDVDDEELSNDEDVEMGENEEELENEDNYSFDGESSEDDDEETDSVKDKWRSNMVKNASDTFYKYLKTTDSIQKLVYGNRFELKEQDDGEDDDIDSTFLYNSTINGLDSTKFDLKRNRDWESEHVLDLIKDCFVTGKWTEDENAEILLRENEDEMEEYGDFEDLEMDNENDENDEDEQGDDLEQKTRMAKKRQLKEQFDTNYDDRNNSDHRKKGEEDENDDEEGPEEAKFYREIKKKLERQAQVIYTF